MKESTRFTPLAHTILAAALGLVTPAPAAFAGATSESTCEDWRMYGRDLGRTFAVRDDCEFPISTLTASSLRPAWVFKTEKTVTASPVVVENTLYVGDWSGTMYALWTDPEPFVSTWLTDEGEKTPRVRWRFETPPAPGAAFGPIVSSAAVVEVDGVSPSACLENVPQVGDGECADVSSGNGICRLVIFGAGPRVYALDAETGLCVWEHYVGAVDENGDPLGEISYEDGNGNEVTLPDQAEVESSPLVWNDRVYVGMDVHNAPEKQTAGVRGGLLVLDVKTGEPVPEFNPCPVPGSPEELETSAFHTDLDGDGFADIGPACGGKLEPDNSSTDRTVGGVTDDQNGMGCGGIWSSPVLDAEDERVYFATANCKADPDDPDATYTWGPLVEAVTAVDAHDGKVLWANDDLIPRNNRRDWDFGATPNLFVDREGQRILGSGNKNGTYYFLDPSSGELFSSQKVAEGGDLPTFIREDFAIGGFIGSPAAYDGRVFGGTAIGGPPYFHALDPLGGDAPPLREKIVWQDWTALPSYAASAVVNGVVFHASLDDTIRAYDAETGAILWANVLLGPSSSGPAIVGNRVYVGSGTSSSDACAKELPGSEFCVEVFDKAVGATGGVHAFELAVP